jgi:hypothetical protein
MVCSGAWGKTDSWKKPEVEKYLLLGHGEDRRLVHLHIVDPHPAEDGEGLHKVLVVGGERQVVKLEKKTLV